MRAKVLTPVMIPANAHDRPMRHHLATLAGLLSLTLYVGRADAQCLPDYITARCASPSRLAPYEPAPLPRPRLRKLVVPVVAQAPVMVSETVAPAAGDSASPAPAPVPPQTPTLSYKVVATEDLYVAAQKYAGQNIEWRTLYCYHANTHEFRCSSLTGPAVVVFLSGFSDPAAQKLIEDNCDALKAAITSVRCRVTLRFHFAVGDVSEDLISGYQKRVIIVTPMAEVLFLGPARRR